MRHRTRALGARLFLIVPLVAWGCMSESPPQAPLPGESQAFERHVTLEVDPASGEIRSQTPRTVLATIESQLALAFDAVNLAQEGDNTTFVLSVRNQGSSVGSLRLQVDSQRPMVAPGNPIELGAVPATGESTTKLTFANADRVAFQVTVRLWATLKATGGLASGGQAGSPAPTAAPTATPTAAPTSTPTAAPTATPTPPPSAGNPGPGALRGRILLNGAPGANVSFSLIRNPGWNSTTLRTDANGYYQATGLADGEYHTYYYNESDRNKVGYWRSRSFRVDGTTGAAVPTIDLYGKGMVNVPKMDARVSFPATFEWVPQAQRVDHYRYRLHSTGGRTFTLIHQSDRIPGDTNRYTWNGAGTSLSSSNRYFWGVFWDAGAAGEGGNLYQAIYFNP